ncbi:MAG: prealbumin-like fold domain-containing protein, partial [Actinomycetota bacterium]
MKSTLRSKYLAASAVLAVIAAVLSNGVAVANHSGLGGVIGGFQVDGNFEFPAPAALGGTRDWASVTTTRIDDKGGDPTDQVFTDGSKENEPDTWAYTTTNLASYPAKTDITRGYFASEVTPSNAYLWLGFERFASEGQGSASMNFELNQKTSKIVNSKGTSIPERTNGDLLVLYDYAGGENAVGIEVREWVGTPLLGTWNLVSPPPNAAFGDINTGTVNRPGGVFGGGSAPKFRFGEAGLDMGVEVFQKFLKCPGISSFYIKSRASSQSFNSALRDTTDPGTIDFSTCGAITVLKDDDSGADLNGATFQLYRDNGDGLFLSPPDAAVTTCVTGEEGTAGQCTFENVTPGTYFVKETAAPEGYVVDPFVSKVTVGRRQTVVVPHVYVDPKIQYRLALTPI